MKAENAARLIDFARQCVRAAVARQAPPALENPDEELAAKRGVFVTLKSAGRLRGCIGTFSASAPLVRAVEEMAKASATGDPRFLDDPIRPDEVDALQIEVSILHPLERIEDPLDFELGKHGVYVRNGHFSGCYLPQVAEETGWSKEEFLTSCCAHKAGLPRHAWKDPNTEVFRFACEIIHS
ncbi:MAG: AmmeMemoRadiSam system protein A [Planctomycetota bacterium]